MAKRPTFKAAGPLKSKSAEIEDQAEAPKTAKRETEKKGREPHKLIGVEVTPETHSALKALCAGNGETMTTVMVRLINRYFEENGKPAIAAAAKK